MVRYSFTIATVLLSVLLATNLAAQETITFLIPLPLTGPYAKFAEIERKSYEIAREEINREGGIRGKHILLEFEDSQGIPELSRVIAEKLINERKQPLVFGEYSSSSSKAIAAVSEKNRIPYLVVTGAADSITRQNYRYVFRMSPANGYYPSGMISFLQDVVKPKTISVLYESSDFGSSGAEVIVKHATRMGMKVLVKEKYEKGIVDFTPVLSKIKRESPDVMYMISYVEDGALLMRQIKENKIDAKLFAGGAAGFAIPEFITLAREASEYVFTAALWSPRVAYPGAKAFAERYRSLYGDYPSYHGAEAYSALFVIKDVLTRATAWTPEEIRNALKTTDLMTAFGSIKFEDKEGYTNQNFMDTLVMQVIGGQHETVWPESYATKKYIYPIPRWRDRR
jgi:branched-chain amino acid transport system substrate-binding protein